MTINWEMIAKANKLTDEEFEQEIYKAACVMGSLRLEESNLESVMMTANAGDSLVRMMIFKVDEEGK